MESGKRKTMADEFNPLKESDEYRGRGHDTDSENTEEEESGEVVTALHAKEVPNRHEERRNQPEPEPQAESGLGRFLLKRLLPGIVAGGAAVLAAPVVLGVVGFGAGGIAAGSMAAGMMSSAAIANGGAVAAGSLVAVLQSAGAVGFTAAANVGIFTAASTVTAGAVEVGSQIQNKVQELTDEKKQYRGDFM